MKATLEFAIPEEQEEHADAVNGTKWHSIVTEFDQHLRAQELLESMREKFINSPLTQILAEGMAKQTEEGIMLPSIAKVYEKTADAVLVQERMKDEVQSFGLPFVQELGLTQHKEAFLAEAKRRKDEADKKK